MDLISRLIFALFIILQSCLVVAKPVPAYWDVENATPPYDFASPSEAGAAFQNWLNRSEYYRFLLLGCTSPDKDLFSVCTYQATNLQTGQVYVWGTYNFPAHCINGAVMKRDSSGNAYCDDGSSAQNCAANDVIGGESSKWYWKGKGSTTCQQGCLYIADQFAYDKNSGYSVGWGRLNGLGAPCTAGQESVSGTPPENKPPNTCEAGKCPGTVNGVAVCVKCGSGGSVEKKTETTTKDSGDGGQSDQTTTKTEKKTTCEDGKCVTETTTTTTSSSGGTKSETAKEEQSQDSFCSKNPDHALCKEQKSEFSGGCASGFRCEGDAVQCAMAREQHERMCQLLDNETDLSKLGNRIGTGQDDQDTKNRLGNGDSPIDISTGFASARPVGPTSGCPADVSVGQWTIPFSRMCPHLNTLGNALVGLAYLVGALIVFRRGGSD